MRRRLRGWWANFKASKTRQLGTLAALIVLAGLLLWPSDVSRVMVSAFIPISWILVFRLKKEKDGVGRK
jgi:hypothetical protein